ncbi:hypothetical protein ACVR1G_08585 [Streptococcus dentasini]
MGCLKAYAVEGGSFADFFNAASEGALIGGVGGAVTGGLNYLI